MALEIAPGTTDGGRYRSGPSGEKDHLDNDAARAAALGLSYGEYKALEREGLLPAQDLPTQGDEEEPEVPAPTPITLPNGQRRHPRKDYPAMPCAQCGETYKPRAINSKYCCDECRDRAWRAKNAAAKKASKEKAKEIQA